MIYRCSTDTYMGHVYCKQVGAVFLVMTWFYGGHMRAGIVRLVLFPLVPHSLNTFFPPACAEFRCIIACPQVSQAPRFCATISKMCHDIVGSGHSLLEIYIFFFIWTNLSKHIPFLENSSEEPS